MYILFHIKLKEHANTELKKDAYLLWVASQTSLPAATTKLIMLPPTCSVNTCANISF